MLRSAPDSNAPLAQEGFKLLAALLRSCQSYKVPFPLCERHLRDMLEGEKRASLKRRKLRGVGGVLWQPCTTSDISCQLNCYTFPPCCGHYFGVIFLWPLKHSSSIFSGNTLGTPLKECGISRLPERTLRFASTGIGHVTPKSLGRCLFSLG